MLFLQLLVNGIQVGMVYALTAVGFSLVFGSTKIFHVAHGAAFIIAAYSFYMLVEVLAVHWLPSLLISLLAVAVFGALLDKIVYGPIERHEASFFTIFVASFGVAIVVQNLIGTVFGRGFVVVSTSLSKGVELLPGLYVSKIAGIAVLCGIGCFSILHLFLTRTHIGMALRALSDNKELVRVYGLDPRQLSTLAIVLGSLFVVPAAVITASSSGLNPAVGAHVMLISIAATIIGGVGSLLGAVCGGLLLGLVENLALWVLDPQWTEGITFVVLLIFIIFRPSGFFGHAIRT